MEIPIFLSSDNSSRGRSHDFTTVFKPEIILDRNLDHFIGLNKIEMSYSWLNVGNAYNNNTLKYSHDSGITFTEIKLLNGNYTYNELQRYINLAINQNGHSSKEGVEDIQFTFYPSILRIMIFLTKTFQLDLREGNFHLLIGGDNLKIIVASEINPDTPNITNSVDAIIINCNIISESLVFGKHSDALELISVSNLSLSYPFSFEPHRILFNKINTNIINKIRIYITDTQSRPLDLNNAPVGVSLILK